jgi:hypothetical protein
MDFRGLFWWHDHVILAHKTCACRLEKFRVEKSAPDTYVIIRMSAGAFVAFLILAGTAKVQGEYY